PGGHWPTKFHQRLFTLNMHGKRMNQETIEPQGASYVGHHDADFFVSQDPFFRGMEISVGPDRNLFIADWSDTGECHEATGVHRTSGRIYKIAYPNRKSTSLPFTKPLCLSADGPLQDLWKAHQNEQLTVEQLHHRLEHSDEHVRAWAIRLLSDFWPLDTILGPKPDTRYPEAPATWAKLQNLAETDSSGIVLLTLASTLQRLPIDERLRIAEALVRREAYAEDPQLPGLVWYGLIPLGQHRPDLLVQLNRDCCWPQLNQWSARLLASQAKDHPEPFNSLLKLAMEREQKFQIEVIRGMTDGFRGRKKVTPPAHWPDFIKSEGAKAMAQPTKRLSILFGEGREIEELRKMALTSSADTHARQNALECLIDADIKDLEEVCLELLATHPLNVTALKGLAKSDDPAVARSMIRRYPQFHPQDRPLVLETLVTRPEFAHELLARLGPGKDQIPSTDLSAFHARQIQALNVPELDRKLSLAWGEVRETSKERREEMARWRNILKDDTIDQADLKAGEKVFQKNCSNCHRLYGKGDSVGPNLTGAQRGDLDYLLTNILDPSAIVGKDYRMTLVETTDGRLLSGLIVSDTPVLLVLQTASQKINIPREEIAVVQTTTSSSMPEGLLSHLSDQEAIDLIGYLMSGR
ncbi:MAG: c-type cytochrome, partial [Planctomycetota bacterium]|nr:c-type cytochrome [Planctomycetota bacterium]